MLGPPGIASYLCAQTSETVIFGHLRTSPQTTADAQCSGLVEAFPQTGPQLLRFQKGSARRSRRSFSQSPAQTSTLLLPQCSCFASTGPPAFSSASVFAGNPAKGCLPPAYCFPLLRHVSVLVLAIHGPPKVWPSPRRPFKQWASILWRTFCVIPRPSGGPTNLWPSQDNCLRAHRSVLHTNPYSYSRSYSFLVALCYPQTRTPKTRPAGCAHCPGRFFGHL